MEEEGPCFWSGNPFDYNSFYHFEGGENLMSDQSITIEKVKNGWTISLSWQEPDEKEGGMNYKSEEFVFLTREEVLTKVDELTKSWDTPQESQ